MIAQSKEEEPAASHHTPQWYFTFKQSLIVLCRKRSIFRQTPLHSPPLRGLWSPRVPLIPVAQFWRSDTPKVHVFDTAKLIWLWCTTKILSFTGATSFAFTSLLVLQILHDQLVASAPEIRYTAASNQLCVETWRFYMEHLSIDEKLSLKRGTHGWQR